MGRHEGETGLIVSTDGDMVTIFSDATKDEMKVRVQDIQECTDVASGTVRLTMLPLVRLTLEHQVKLGAYELHDLVQLSPTRVGVIIRIERDIFRILDHTGSMVSCRLQEMGRRRNSRDAETFDHNRVS